MQKDKNKYIFAFYFMHIFLHYFSADGKHFYGGKTGSAKIMLSVCWNS
jgi:TM2 domain-containing membrane protein YozV